MEIEKYCSDILTREFLKKYTNKKVPWGFGDLSYIVYKRTYSRTKENDQQEEWWETIARCLNGSQKIGAKYSRQEAERLYDYMFNLKCFFSGRGLWQLGTKTVDIVGNDSLLNCWVTKVSEVDDFYFIFSESMLGGGVGCNISREYTQELPRVKREVRCKVKNTKDADFIVPDSKEGWAYLWRKILRSYLVTGDSFTYSNVCIRPAGEPLKTFGGLAPGPKPLMDGCQELCRILESREGKKLRTQDVADIICCGGQIVKSGGIRRTALILLGDVDDVAYLNLKRWDSDFIIPPYRSNSNNSLICNNYNHLLDKYWESYNGSGECYGLFNLKNSKRFGRLNETKIDGFDLFDDDIIGGNPCQPAWAKILAKDGWTNFGDIKAGDEIWSEMGWTKVVKKWSTGINKVYRYNTEEGCVFNGTKRHRIVQKGKKIEVDDAEFIDCFQEGKRTSNWEISDRKTRKTKPSKITSREYVSTEETFDIEVDNTFHTYWTQGCNVSNCAEALLADKEPCNLAELALNNIESKEEMLDCATLLYKTQKAVAAGNYLFKETNEIVHKKMRLGLGVTGVCQNPNYKEWCDYTYKELRKFDKKYSKENNWPQSIRLTVVKPSGTLSLLSGSSPGANPGYSQYHFRTVRFSTMDKLVPLLKNAGYHIEPEKRLDKSLNHDIAVVYFPCKFLDSTICEDKSDSIDQLERIKLLQTFWADQAVSNTIYYKPEDLSRIKEWLKNNYDSSIKTVSFLLHSGHGFEQAVLQPTTKEKYQESVKLLKSLQEIETNNELMDNIECQSGHCPIR